MTAESKSIDYSVLKDRSIIVTGGASGLGEAIVTRFAPYGAYITIADMQEELGQALTKKLNDEGAKISFVKCNTTDWDSLTAAFKHAINFSPSKTLDIAALFAGTDGEAKGLIDLVEAVGPPSLDDNLSKPPLKAVDVNLYGVYLSTFLALHYFRLPSPDPQPFKKSLIFVSSMMGYIDLPYNTGYAMSKFGIRGLFRSIRPQAHRFNVRVNNIVPAYILTPLTKKIHKIDDPTEPSKATGYVLPWADIGYVVDAVGRCATDEEVDGRSWSVSRSGYVDMNEDVEHGYGGKEYLELLERDGLFDIPSLFPKSKV